MFVWFNDKSNRIKLEIGSSVRPDPYSKKVLKSYIHEFLDNHNGEDDIEKYELCPVELNVLNIERTFVDKLMSVKRHAMCGTIGVKVRHIYDVARLFKLPEIKAFLNDKVELKRLIEITKETDSYYLEKRNINSDYNPKGEYDFDMWKHYLDDNVCQVYENLHNDLLYMDEKQKFKDAIESFSNINKILKEIDE